jgi:hypothetical protein
MSTIAQVQAKMTGTVLTATAATAGPDKVLPGDAGSNVYVIVQNGSGGAITVPFANPGVTKYGQANPAVASVSIPAAGFAVFGPVQGDLAQVSDGLAQLTASSATSVTYFAFRG